ncbi:putative protein-serine/threonine phosphatase [Medicago truncatula]|uniref:PPM-type phosphatase domain-containing protein n=1 Tax=Medicago truncatula TaxID=3880 RepID=A0A396IHU2_MEDTR|nr:putative protein-serine/threonine phosphatase [Medicago truncatula]
MVVPPFLTCGRSGKGKDEEEEKKEKEKAEEEVHDNLVWCEDRKENDYHCSIATSQSNTVMEDFYQVEFGKNSLFVGVYDGHKGLDAARFIRVCLFPELSRLVTENKVVSEDIMEQAVDFIEKGFKEYVTNNIDDDGRVGSVGSCCLFGIIWGRTLFVANVGDSRAILGSSKGFFKRPHVVQLTVDHHVSHAAAREEIRNHITNDPFVLCKNRGSLRVKSLIEITRSIGDAYLKWSDPHPSFETFSRYEANVISEKPFTDRRDIDESDKFLIFASHGFWKLMTNSEAADIVYNNSQDGISKRLVRAALEKAINDIITYCNLQNLKAGNGLLGRRHYYDDVTVIVIFLNKRSDTPTTEPEFQSTTSTNELKDFKASSSQSNSHLPMALGSMERFLSLQDITPDFLDAVKFLQKSLLEKSGDGDKNFKDLAFSVGEILKRIQTAHKYCDLADKNLKDPTISQDEMDVYMKEFQMWKENLEKAKSDWISIRKRIDELSSSERKIVEEEITLEALHENPPSKIR